MYYSFGHCQFCRFSREAADRAATDGLIDPVAFDGGRAVLRTRGRLLADAVVRDLVA